MIRALCRRGYDRNTEVESSNYPWKREWDGRLAPHASSADVVKLSPVGLKVVAKPRYSGFTLIELLITVALAAILLTVGVPTFRYMILNNRIVTPTNEPMLDRKRLRSGVSTLSLVLHWKIISCRGLGP